MRKTSSFQLKQYKNLLIFLTLGILVSVLVFISFLSADITRYQRKFHGVVTLDGWKKKQRLKSVERGWFYLKNYFDDKKLSKSMSLDSEYEGVIKNIRVKDTFLQVCLYQRESKKIFYRLNYDSPCGELRLKDSAYRKTGKFFEGNFLNEKLLLQKTLKNGLILMGVVDLKPWSSKREAIDQGIFNFCFKSSGKVIFCNKKNEDGLYIFRKTNKEYHYTETFKFFDTDFQIAYYPTTKFLSRAISFQPVLMIIICLLITFAICYVVFQMTGQKAALEKTLRKQRKTLLELAVRTDEVQRFLNLISHDLRTPISGIASLVSFLEDDEGDNISEESKKHIQRIHERIGITYAMIDSVTKYAELEKSKLVLNSIQDVKSLFFEEYEKCLKELNLLNTKINFIGDFYPLWADKDFFSLAIKNLIKNCLVFNTNEKKQIDIYCKIKGISLQYVIQDNGVGINPENHDKIFDMFRVLKLKQDIKSGIGVGLSFVKKVVDLHNGVITIESNEGEGTKVIMTFPQPRKHLNQLGIY